MECKAGPQGEKGDKGDRNVKETMSKVYMAVDEIK